MDIIELKIKFNAIFQLCDELIEACRQRRFDVSRSSIYRITDGGLIELIKTLKNGSGIADRFAWETLKRLTGGLVRDIQAGRFDDVFGHEDIVLTPFLLMFACMASRPGGLHTMELIRKCHMSLSGGVLELDLFTEGAVVGGVIADSFGLPTHADGTIDKVGSTLKIGKGLLFGKW